MFGVKVVLVITSILMFAIGLIFGYHLAKRRFQRQPQVKPMWRDRPDIQQLIDEGMLQVVGLSKPRVRLKNLSSRRIYLGFSDGVSVESGKTVQVNRPE